MRLVSAAQECEAACLVKLKSKDSVAAIDRSKCDADKAIMRTYYTGVIEVKDRTIDQLRLDLAELSASSVPAWRPYVFGALGLAIGATLVYSVTRP